MIAVKNWVFENHTLGWLDNLTRLVFSQLNHLGQKTKNRMQEFENFSLEAKSDFSSEIEQIQFFIPMLVYLTFHLGHVWLYSIQAEAEKGFVTLKSFQGK